jgi:CrcB protein
MGGFTTYSSFNYETLRFLQEGNGKLGSLNLSVTVIACLVSGTLGVLAGRLATGS